MAKEKTCKFITVVGGVLSSKTVGEKNRKVWELGVKDKDNKITFFFAFPTSKVNDFVFDDENALYKFSCFYDFKYPEYIKVYEVVKI
ncbi:MAG: hypothetical protein MJ230_07600 [bacterium]|nr:hypothetical protein [bacterium]